MFALVKKMQQEKVEHESDPASCEDYSDFSIKDGLFVAADGAGTAIFANIWAKHLVEHFLAAPLMNKDLFEVEWWIRQAQSTFAPKVPLVQDWNARQKAQTDGSQSTLATMRISEIADLAVKVEFLVFGDSCIIVGSTISQTIESFPLEQPEDFDARPICLPSLLKKFNRDFNICQTREKTLQPHDIVIIATDAVASWIINGKGRPGGQWAAFREVAEKKPGEEWKVFVQTCRDNKTMVDDDSTALVIEFKAEEVEGTEQLGMTIPPHALHVREERKKRYDEAHKISNRELMAIYFGDGVDLRANDDDSPGIHPSEEEFQHNRHVANALKALIAALRAYINSPNAVQKIEEAWRKYEPILLNEPCAEAIRKTISNKGIILDSKDLIESTQSPKKDQKEPLLPLVIPLTSPSQTSLEQFRKAIESNNDAQIICAFDSSLNENPVVTAEEWIRLRKAIYAFYKGCKIEEEIKQATALLGFWHAFYNNQDSKIVEKYDELKNYKPDIILPSMALERLSLARKKQKQLESFHEALVSGNAQKIVDTFQSLSVNGSKDITNDEREQLQWAKEWLKAYTSDDDSRIINVSNSIKNSPQNKFITFTIAEEQRIQLALERKKALQELKKAIDTNRPSQIFSTYNDNKGLLEKDKQVLSQEQEEIVKLAGQLVEAYSQNDNLEIVKARDSLSKSPFAKTFAFTYSEDEQHEQAKKWLENIVAVVDKEYGTSEWYTKIALVRNEYISHRLKTLSDRLNTSNDNKVKRIEQIWLQKERETFYPFGRTQDNITIKSIIDDIINDIIIQQQVIYNKDAQIDRSQYKQNQKLLFDSFKSSRGFEKFYRSPYSLTDADIKDVIGLFLRRSYLFYHLLRTNSTQSADQWLDAHKARTHIIRYPEHIPRIELSRNWLGGLLS